MRPTLVRMFAIGNSPWFPLDYIQAPFSVSLFVNPGTGVTLAAKVQLTGDDITTNQRQPTSLTRVAALATCVLPNHGAVTGDSVVVSQGGPPFDTVYTAANPVILPYTFLTPGSADITVVDANTFTYAVPNLGPLAASPGVLVGFYRVFDHATLGAVTVRAQGNIAFPVRAARLQVSNLVGGAASVDFTILQGAAP